MPTRKTSIAQPDYLKESLIAVATSRLSTSILSAWAL